MLSRELQAAASQVTTSYAYLAGPCRRAAPALRARSTPELAESRRGVATESLMQLRAECENMEGIRNSPIYSGSFACICDKFRYNPCGHSKMSLNNSQMFTPNSL